MTPTPRRPKVEPLETRVRNYPKMMSLKDREGLAAEATLIAADKLKKDKLKNDKLKNKKKPVKTMSK